MSDRTWIVKYQEPGDGTETSVKVYTDSAEKATWLAGLSVAYKYPVVLPNLVSVEEKPDAKAPR